MGIEKLLNEMNEFYDTEDIFDYIGFLRDCKYDMIDGIEYLYDNTKEDYKHLENYEDGPSVYDYMIRYQERVEGW